MRRLAAGSFTLMALGAALMGCPKGQCFFEVCTNGDCRCHIDTCVDGASFDTKARTCRCDPGHFSVAGQCLVQTDADAFCGRGYRWAQTGCAKIQCPPDQHLDDATGQCVDPTQVAGNMGVQVGQGETIQCPAGTVLVVEGGAGACVPQEHTCAPDEQYNGQTCVKTAQCPTGSQFDPAKGVCVAYASQGDDDTVVDVTQWATTAYGPNGGQGTAAFCNKFARHPWRFGIPAGQSANVRVVVQLAFQGGEIAAGVATTAPSYVNNPTPVPAQGREAVQTAANEILATLKKGGGKASAPQTGTAVTCLVRNAAAPVVVPATGGV